MTSPILKTNSFKCSSEVKPRDFTPTPGIPLSSLALQFGSFEGSSTVEPWDFTPDLHNSLRALYAQ